MVIFVFSPRFGIFGIGTRMSTRSIGMQNYKDQELIKDNNNSE